MASKDAIALAEVEREEEVDEDAADEERGGVDDAAAESCTGVAGVAEASFCSSDPPPLVVRLLFALTCAISGADFAAELAREEERFRVTGSATAGPVQLSTGAVVATPSIACSLIW